MVFTVIVRIKLHGLLSATGETALLKIEFNCLLGAPTLWSLMSSMNFPKIYKINIEQVLTRLIPVDACKLLDLL